MNHEWKPGDVITNYRNGTETEVKTVEKDPKDTQANWVATTSQAVCGCQIQLEDEVGTKSGFSF